MALDIPKIFSYKLGMAQHFVNRGGYYSLEQSYRDEHGRPRKRRLAYYGRNKPFNCLTDVDWSATLQGTPEDRAMAAAERAAEKAEATKAPVQEQRSRLPDGLTVGPTDPVPVEPAAATEANSWNASAELDTASEQDVSEGEGSLE